MSIYWDNFRHYNHSLYYIEYVKRADRNETCVIRMFGITQQGNSVMAHVHNFTPYFYVEVDTRKVASFTPHDLQQIKNELNSMN